jgi:CelD/BcsL family acetyltransferase involved in cellulose biosynthesis
MFDYLKNEYNPHPLLFLQNDRSENFLYVKYATSPYMDLPSTQDLLRSIHKKKFWYNIRRSEKLFNDKYGELHFDVLTDKDRLIFFLDQVYTLFNDRWSKEYTSFIWKNKEGFEKYKTAMIDLAVQDKAFLAVLYDSNKKLLSYGYCLVEEGVVYFYQHTTTIQEEYRKYSLGRVFLNQLVKYCIDSKYKKIDFMTGNSGYKKEWANNVNYIYRLAGKKSFIGYIKKYLIKVKYFFQFNRLTRPVLKSVFKVMDKLL